MKKIIKEELDEAIQSRDPLKIGAVIVYWGNTSLADAKEAFDYAARAGVKGFPEEHDSSLSFEMDGSKWDERYFDQHTHQMRKNFSRKAFEHYVAVGKKVFPHKVRRGKEDGDEGHHTQIAPGRYGEKSGSRLIVPVAGGIFALIGLGLLYLLLRK